jgi:hypothetical protein
MIKGRRAPTSEVFDFTFDMDVKRKRQDAGKLRVRIDYSNTPGYWNAAVDSPGIQSSSSEGLGKRFFADLPDDWREMYLAVGSDESEEVPQRGDVTISEKFDAPIFWDDVDGCNVNGDEYYQGFAAHVEGSFNAEYTYGFTIIVGSDSRPAPRSYIPDV